MRAYIDMRQDCLQTCASICLHQASRLHVSESGAACFVLHVLLGCYYDLRCCAWWQYPLSGAVGHAYYFLEDVYPHMSHGRRPLKTPGLIKALFPAEQIQSTRPTAAPAAAAPAAPNFPAPGVVPPPVGKASLKSHSRTLTQILSLSG